MSRVNRPLLAFALLACASVARAESLRLVSPANGASLRGGSFAEVRWSATQLPAGTEEWEAFLSVDGGKYYAFRITPHLEIDLQRFTFIVPNVDTHDARILIRTGDEVRETHFEARGSFSIVRDANAEQVLPELLHLGRAEAARDGDPAVVSWTDGARNGSGVTQRSAPSVPSSSVGQHTTFTTDASAGLEEPAANRVEAPSISSWQRPVRDRQAQSVAPVAEPLNLLLVCRRRNI